MAEEVLANRYRLDQILGAGGMATVYRAHDLFLDRPVAVKVMRSQGGFSQSEHEEFLREARIVAGLNHPNIIAVHDAGSAAGMPFLVMELLSGVTLRQRLLDGPLPPSEALRVTRRLASALETAHARGILHLDIKPENVIFSASGEPKLTDFGISRALGEDATRPDGTLMGTPAYLAPEYVTRRPIDARADVYSLGVVLYELLTGKLPFVGESPAQQMRQRLSRDPIVPHAQNPAIPEGLEQIVLKVLSRNPAERPGSMAELATALEDYERLSERRTQTVQALEVGAAPARPLPRTTIQLEPAAQRPLERLATPQPQPVAFAPPAQPAPRPAPAPPARPSVARAPITRSLPQPRRIAAWGLLLLLLALGAFAAARALTGNGQSGVGQVLPPVTSAPAPTREPAQGFDRPEATSVPTEPTAPPATAAPSPAPTDLPPPPTEAPVIPTEAPVIPTEAPPPPPVISEPGSVLLEDTAWVGGYRSASGTYGGRTATWIYGYSTQYSVMATTFALQGQPAGTASFTVEGMDSENWPKTAISIMVNGVEIYNGPNPLPDDDQPLETGVWGSYAWSFDASLLGPGENVISIANLEQGGFSVPPFFMLDYAEVTY